LALTVNWLNIGRKDTTARKARQEIPREEAWLAKSEDFHRECREFANDAKKPKKIREIRPFALFAFHFG
jgi:hypothetical protein